MKTIGFIIIATLLSLSLYWFSSWIRHPKAEKKTSSDTIIATYINDVEVRQFDPSGTLQHKLTAPSITQQNKSPLIYIEQPDVWIIQKGHLWELSGRKGLYNMETLRFTIRDDVVIKQPENRLVVTTSQLDYDDNTQLISSDETVTIRSPQGNISAKGLSINLDDETIELNQEIKTQYRSKQSQSK